MAGFSLVRNRQPELMDQPGLDENLHRQALAALRRVNRLSATAGRLWRSLRPLFASDPTRTWRVLDVASGGGDVAIALATRARRAGLQLEVAGCDISPTAIQFARNQAATADAPNTLFFQHDLLSTALPRDYDVVTCTLFLHHLDNDDAALLLRRMREAARELTLLDDLRRTQLGYYMAWFACRVLTRSPIVHVDGPRSVEGAFTSQEAAELARRSGWGDVRIQHHWPERFLLSGRPS